MQTPKFILDFFKNITQRITAGNGVTITGDGSFYNPMIISAEAIDVGVTSVNGDTGDVLVATVAQGDKADTALQPGDSPTWTTISGKPAYVAEGANNTAARTSLGLGTAATTDATAYATAAQGTLANTAVQPATLEARFSSASRIAIDELISTSTLEEVIAALQA